MKRKLSLLAAVFIAMTLSLTACGNNRSQESSEMQTNESEVSDMENSETDKTETNNSDTESSSALPTVDRAGNTITVPENVEKVISLAPSTTQVIDALGELSKVIAVDTQTPLYVEGMDELLQYDMMTPDCEAMLSQNPDIVFVSGLSYVSSENPFQILIDAGICVVEIPSSSSIAAVKEDIEFIADCLSKGDEGRQITTDMQKEIDEIAEIGASITEQKAVMFEIAASPAIYSFGKDVFLNEMLTIIGAKNVFIDQDSWIPVTDEAAILANPDVILTNVNYIENPVDEILSRAGWGTVTAVKDKQVYYVDNETTSLPNQYIIKALKQMAKSVYPEAYADIEDPFLQP